MSKQKVTFREGLAYDETGRLLGFEQGASEDVVRRYIASARWAPVVEEFVPNEKLDRAPDGRLFGGHRVGDLKRDYRGHAQIEGPAPTRQLHRVDLSAYRDDQHVRITWRRIDPPQGRASGL
jgi:hypothetical protein